MTRFNWAKGALALALALGVGGMSPLMAEDEFDDVEMDYESEAPSAPGLTVRDLDLQLSSKDDEDFPGAYLVTFHVSGGADLGMATGFLVEDAKSGALVFQDGYLDPSEDDENALIGMAAWSVGAGDCGTTRNLNIVVISEEFTEEGETMVTRLAETSGTIAVPASYCSELGIGTD